jgi:uncharacterized protein YndB with AHSA1/START domain
MNTATARKIRDDELLIERTFDAPVELVFRLWESRDHMIRWWGPEQFTCLELDWEMKPGRAWRAKMVAKEWKVTGMGGVIREVEKNKRIVFTFRWDDPAYETDTVVTVTFAEKDGQTVQTFHQTPFSDVKDRDDHIGGWNSLFNKQQRYTENLAFAEKAGWRQ